MKKILTAAASLLVAAAMTAPAFAEPETTPSPEENEELQEVQATAAPTKSPISSKYTFSDISDKKYAWAADYIQDMYEGGYITGYEDNTYRPDNEVTRQECLSLFARAMGSGNEANEKILEMAHEKYDDILKLYGLSWGSDEIAYLMYRGALKESDLVTYLKNDEKSKPMSRYEAAIIITKAMGGEKEASASTGITLSYSDAKSIPTSALGYVKYVTDNGIMNGMDNNNFSPNTSVLRSQIAVMLARVIDKCDYSFETVKLTSINTNDKSLVIKESDGTSRTHVYTGNTVMKTAGVEMQPADMVVGVSAIITFSGDMVSFVDTVSSVPDETVVGKYQSYANSKGILFVNLVPTGETAPVMYECAPDVSILYDNSPATIKSFKNGDYVSLSLADGVIETINGTTKTETLEGAIVTEISISPKLTMTISSGNEEYNGKELDVANDVIVTKNGATSSMDMVYSGDQVTLTLEYGVVTKVAATSKSSSKEGIIRSITYSDRSNIVVAINGEEKEFEVPNSCAITYNGQSGTLYDFRVGDRVKMTIESNAVTKIEVVASTTTTGSIIGKVQSINSSYGFISVLVDDNEIAQTVFCRDTTTKFLNATTGDTLSMKNINEGDTVQVNGSYTNGAFVAKVVLVTPVN